MYQFKKERKKPFHCSEVILLDVPIQKRKKKTTNFLGLFPLSKSFDFFLNVFLTKRHGSSWKWQINFTWPTVLKF